MDSNLNNPPTDETPEEFHAIVAHPLQRTSWSGDAVLLLGGMGVQQCARPAYRALGSHLWQHKRRGCGCGKGSFQTRECSSVQIDLVLVVGRAFVTAVAVSPAAAAAAAAAVVVVVVVVVVVRRRRSPTARMSP